MQVQEILESRIEQIYGQEGVALVPRQALVRIRRALLAAMLGRWKPRCLLHIGNGMIVVFRQKINTVFFAYHLVLGEF
jgi:hypothetical protein